MLAHLMPCSMGAPVRPVSELIARGVPCHGEGAMVAVSLLKVDLISMVGWMVQGRRQ